MTALVVALVATAAAPPSIAAGATAAGAATAVASAAVATAAGAAASAASASAEDMRQARFLELLRTYPQRPVVESHRLVTSVIDEGPFPERDRAIYWLGSAQLAARDTEGAQAAFAKLRREHPGSAWIDRTLLGEAEIRAQRRRYGEALAWLDRAAASSKPEVVQMARIAAAQVAMLRTRQRWAVAAGAFALLVVAGLAASLVRRRAFALLPVPAEVRVVLPVLAVIALLSVRQDPAPRAAVLQVCAAGALLVTLSALRLRAAQPGRLGAAVQVSATLGALGACFYVAVWQAELIGMVVDTFRVGPQ